MAGDWREVELADAAFNLAIVANLTHLQTTRDNTALMQKIHAALQLDGEIIIIDAMPRSTEGDVPFALYHLGLALRTQNGRVYSLDELQQMLGNGFQAQEVIPLDVAPHMVGMLVAKKR